MYLSFTNSKQIMVKHHPLGPLWLQKEFAFTKQVLSNGEKRFEIKVPNEKKSFSNPCWFHINFTSQLCERWFAWIHHSMEVHNTTKCHSWSEAHFQGKVTSDLNCQWSKPAVHVENTKNIIHNHKWPPSAKEKRSIKQSTNRKNCGGSVA